VNPGARRAGLAVAVLAALALPACPVSTPSICDVQDGEVVIFPASAVDVPTNVVVRVLTGGSAESLHVLLIDPSTETVEPGDEVLLVTTFGDVLELTPRFELLSDADYRIEVVDDFDNVVATAFFSTGVGSEAGPALAPGAVTVDPIAGEDRACCTGGGCVDGSLVSLPPLAADNFSPQLVLVTVDELFNDACGAQQERVGVIPVVWDGDGSFGLSAETDLFLDGCYILNTVTQTLREGPSTDMVCAPGVSFVPAGPTDQCRASTSGCGCDVAATPAQTALALAFAAGLLLWLWRRRRTG